MSCRVRAREAKARSHDGTEVMSCRVRACDLYQPVPSCYRLMSCRVRARNDSPRWGQSPQNWGR